MEFFVLCACGDTNGSFSAKSLLLFFRDELKWLIMGASLEQRGGVKDGRPPLRFGECLQRGCSCAEDLECCKRGDHNIKSCAMSSGYMEPTELIDQSKVSMIFDLS